MFLIQVSQGGAVLFAPPRKAVAFLTTRSVCQKDGTGISLPAARSLQPLSSYKLEHSAAATSKFQVARSTIPVGFRAVRL